MAAPNRQSIRSQTAGTSVLPVATTMEKARSTWGVRALQVAALASAFFGGLGLAASFAIDRHKNSVIAHNSKQVLADYFRHQVAAQLGMDPSKVSVNDLELAAKVNPMFAQAIAKVEHERKNDNRAATFATGGALAAGGLLPGLSGINYAVAHGAGAIIGGMTSSLFNKDSLQPLDVLTYINEKRVQGQRVTASDIVMLRISQNESVQAEIKKANNGTAFHKMNEAQQLAVIKTMPGMADAAEFADKINNGFITEQDVLVAEKPKPTWTSRVGGQRAPRESFVSSLNAERAAAVTTGPNL